MSDSEDEGAFASADEGDSPTKGSSSTKGHRGGKRDVKKEVDAQKSSGTSVKGKSVDTAADSGKKETEKQQKQSQAQGRRQKKGKTNAQNPQPNTSKAVSDPSSSKPIPQGDVTQEQPSPTKTNEKQKEGKIDEKQTKLPEESLDSPSDKKDSETKIVTPKVLKEETIDEAKANPGPNTKTESNDVDQSSPVKQNPATHPEKTAQSGGGGGWGWGGWGSSLLSAASTSVQTFTHQIGDGISTIMDTVESSLDDLVTDEKAKSKDASEKDSSLADNVKESDGQKSQETSKGEEKDAHQTKNKPGEDKPEDKPEAKTETSESGASNPSGGNFFASWGITDIAKKMTDTGKSLASKGQTLMTDGFDAVENLASGGIDVLESIGKKTYHTFSEHDPAFKKTREYLKSRGTKPNLSSVLREAKEQAEHEATKEKENEESRKVHFETQLDEYQGIAHLEALEMLSGQSEKKVLSLLNSLSSDDHKVIKPILISIKEVFEVDEEDADTSDDRKEQDFSSLVSKHLSELKLGTSSDKLNKVHDMVKQWMADLEMQDSYNPKAIHQQAIQSLAELTSKGVEQFHKAGELVLMQRDSEKDCKERAHSFARLTGVLCHEVGILATKFTDCLNKSVTAEKEEETDVTAMVTNIYLEASNSTTYIQDAFQLLLPIIQQAAIEHLILSRQS